MFPRHLRNFSALTPAVMTATLACSFIGWRALSSVDQSIQAATQSADAIEESLLMTETLLADTSASIGTLRTTLIHLEAASESGTQSIRDASELASSLPGNLENIQDGLERTRGAADSVDSITRTLASTPLIGGGIEPTELGPTLRDLATDIDPLISDLEATSISLDDLANDADILASDIPRISSDLQVLEADLSAGAESMSALSLSLSEDDPLGQGPGIGTLRLLIILVAGTSIGVEAMVGLVLYRLESLEVIDRADA